jgi:hypothetical protein
MSDMAKFRLMLGAGILFIFSCVMSYGELRYLCFGETVEATIISAKQVEVRGRRGRTSTRLKVEYRYEDSGGILRTDSDRVSTDWELPETEEIQVQCIAGTDSSRLAGHTQMIWVYVFGLCLVGVLGAGLKFWKFYKS